MYLINFGQTLPLFIDDCDDNDDGCSDPCDDDDDECKKKKKKTGNKNTTQKKKKKKTSSKKGNKKTSNKKGTVTTINKKKVVRYPPVQKIRKSLSRGLLSALRKRSAAIESTRGGNGGGGGGSGGGGHGIGNIGNAVGNAFLNKVDDLLSIKDNGLFGNNSQSDDGNTGCSIIEGWSCPRLGRYAHPIDCQKYVRCTLRGENTVYECDDDEAYDPSTRQCTTDWSSCEALDQCLYHRQLIEDPSDDNSYFICIENNHSIRESYTLYRRQCAEERIFDEDYQQCMDEDDIKRLRKEKRRRNKVKKQKKCSKRKGNGTKKDKKNKKQ